MFESLTKMITLHLQNKSFLRLCFVVYHDIQPITVAIGFNRQTVQVRLLELEFLFSVEF